MNAAAKQPCEQRSFSQCVTDCTAEFDTVLTDLCGRHGVLPVVCAATDRLGNVLKALLQRKALDPKDIRLLLYRLQRTVYARDTAEFQRRPLFLNLRLRISRALLGIRD
jgi:hypothetical protein